MRTIEERPISLQQERWQFVIMIWNDSSVQISFYKQCNYEHSIYIQIDSRWRIATTRTVMWRLWLGLQRTTLKKKGITQKTLRIQKTFCGVPGSRIDAVLAQRVSDNFVARYVTSNAVSGAVIRQYGNVPRIGSLITRQPQIYTGRPNKPPDSIENLIKLHQMRCSGFFPEPLITAASCVMPKQNEMSELSGTTSPNFTLRWITTYIIETNMQFVNVALYNIISEFCAKKYDSQHYT